MILLEDEEEEVAVWERGGECVKRKLKIETDWEKR